MTDTYLRVRGTIRAEIEDDLPHILAPFGVLGSEIGEAPEGRVSLEVFLAGSDGEAAEGVRRVLLEHGAGEVELGELEAADWLAGFREQVRPFEIGRLWWIDPHPESPTAAPPGRHRLVIEPRMAFGTGTHESTRLVLLALEELEVMGRTVLDVGTGSGILALAAERMGARTVVGLDIDPTAVWVASEIARQQDWAVAVDFILGPVGCLAGAPFDIVLCNMIASNFLPLADDLRSLVEESGVVVFSGVLRGEIEAVSQALASSDLEVISIRTVGEWASLNASTGMAL